MAQTQTEHAVIGPPSNFWLYNSDTGFDLTHPASPTSAPVHPRLSLQTTSNQITVDPAKTALVVIDMQNFFLSPELGRPAQSAGLRACSALLENAIPAVRSAGIRIAWVNWALTQDDIENAPPGVSRSFGFKMYPEGEDGSDPSKGRVRLPPGKNPKLYVGWGGDLGDVKLKDGSVVKAGRALMEDQWNSDLYQPLLDEHKTGKTEGGREDLMLPKNRMSGFWRDDAPAVKALRELGISTLLFAGVNTDQCVGGSLQDAYNLGFDVILLRDGCGTTSPEAARQGIEYNCEKTWGFVLDSEELVKGVKDMT